MHYIIILFENIRIGFYVLKLLTKRHTARALIEHGCGIRLNSRFNTFWSMQYV